MIEYPKDIIQNFSEEITGCIVTPDADHLFNENPDGVKLDEAMVRQFHTSAAKLLFVCNQAHHDMQTAVDFLTTCVKSPEKDNWKKLKQDMTYLNGTLELIMTLGVNSLNITKWWVDGSYVVHPDMRGQTGVTMSLGQESLCS
eukprot:3573717-Ditylum_brightwellii.AAC.1